MRQVGRIPLCAMSPERHHEGNIAAGSSERILLYYAEVLKTGKVGAGGGVTGENEDIKTVEYSPEELDHVLASGEIQDAKTIIAIKWWRMRFQHPEKR